MKKKLSVIALFFTLFLGFSFRGEACENCAAKKGDKDKKADCNHEGHTCTGPECKSCGQHGNEKHQPEKSKGDLKKESKEDSRAPNSEDDGEEEFEKD